jgi:hypothetical protein
VLLVSKIYYVSFSLKEEIEGGLAIFLSGRLSHLWREHKFWREIEIECKQLTTTSPPSSISSTKETSHAKLENSSLTPTSFVSTKTQQTYQNYDQSEYPPPFDASSLHT